MRGSINGTISLTVSTSLRSLQFFGSHSQEGKINLEELMAIFGLCHVAILEGTVCGLVVAYVAKVPICFKAIPKKKYIIPYKVIWHYVSQMPEGLFFRSLSSMREEIR